jgi:hypothetical protein
MLGQHPFGEQRNFYASIAEGWHDDLVGSEAIAEAPHLDARGRLTRGGYDHANVDARAL